MDAIIEFFESLVPAGFDVASFLKAALVLFLGAVILGVLGRLIFGRHSVLNSAVSAAISILFIYAITIIIHSFGVNLAFLVSPLPFISISGDYLKIFHFSGVHYTIICDQILSMIILAFLANLADGWLPKGKNLFSWLFFRCISVLLAMILHLLVTAIINALLPQGLLTWAPVVLLGLLIVMMLVGALKILVGALLSTVHPLIGILYTFFFANVVGKQISKAVLTTGIISGIVYLLDYMGCSMIFIASSALAAYLPFLLLLFAVWYIVGNLL